MIRRSLLFLSERKALRDLLLRMPVARQVADRFVAGETHGDALRAARRLNDRGFRVTLDYLGESVQRSPEAERATEIYERSLDAIDSSDAESTLSLKLTQLGLAIDEEFCARNLDRIVRRAAALDNFVRIDMEDSTYTEATLGVFRRVYAEHDNVAVVIQSYLRRSERDIEELAGLGAPVRLCKGAYSEPPEVAFQRRSEIDRNFIRLTKMLLDGGAPTAIATHDHRMIEAARSYAAERGIEKHAYELQMLFGIRRDYQARLVTEGHAMRIYVPYGTQWYPYLMRRMAQRPANLWFVVRAMLGD